ncbi:50S ribosomal protein L6 [Synechocystis sp. PCC 6803]|jgi:large subunit ribosomal protein L6|uniref:Large ribosomal subunit protein uL6 n=1 Tax=Synechocystis sp. (strain ATCC 27184 / PCC 6803 / Kazusa) TaxID=1111708 RepID=RL6_SYNY3|nr:MULTISPECIES: 50S ribosomal protein L6 [unclassified Synechocystis]P73306.1 RecName: Full=Large ribosomal subunit protein uL6; AltName: Full=50S ribosomal protein L6 [Synechocystis sp. PCC 6803 substr. Kazusa]WLT37539.1 50S ribosomal protein L6 [Synechocystis sp. B12]BAM51059.1 50S ribosomal protein L6 [Synechocystis sp. PCC 6803] [Bacillus subtilis BEST7613]AGF51024.1 50S ribosomal protein L6 [Synechocystis sp. PCC 6803]ALJ67062.1 50S ribosomal protein L6 [Synechocystis sp. PCC 6803]AVP88
MSRIGKRPIPLPAKVSVDIQGSHLSVKGPKGSLERQLPEKVIVAQEGETITVTRQDESRTARERHGLVRTLVANMVDGVAQGFERRLEIQGVGYRAQAQGNKLTLNVGYSKPVEMTMPQGIEVKVENNTQVIVSGIDKELLGNTAAKIRAVRPPEPYKGKGIRYQGEYVRRKAGKTGKK